jgi:hypothetical protein
MVLSGLAAYSLDRPNWAHACELTEDQTGIFRCLKLAMVFPILYRWMFSESDALRRTTLLS